MQSSKIGVRVSSTDQFKDTMSRRDVPPPKNLPHDIMQLRAGSVNVSLVPAVIALRTVLEVIRTSKGVMHQWKVTLSPDNDLMRRRFLAENGTLIGDGAALRDASPSYGMIQALEDAHRQISDVGAPEPLDGTTVHLWLGYKQGGAEFFQVEASSLAGVRRELARINNENMVRRRQAQIRVPVVGWRLWQGSYVPEPVPEVPTHDEWLTMHTEALKIIFQRTFKPCLKSLWKAVFGTGVNANQLRLAGFPSDLFSRQVADSDHGLRELIRKQDQASRRTFVFDPDQNVEEL